VFHHIRPTEYIKTGGTGFTPQCGQTTARPGGAIKAPLQRKEDKTKLYQKKRFALLKFWVSPNTLLPYGYFTF
jgi:hypothetical protein